MVQGPIVKERNHSVRFSFQFGPWRRSQWTMIRENGMQFEEYEKQWSGILPASFSALVLLFLLWPSTVIENKRSCVIWPLLILSSHTYYSCSLLCFSFPCCFFLASQLYYIVSSLRACGYAFPYLEFVHAYYALFFP